MAHSGAVLQYFPRPVHKPDDRGRARGGHEVDIKWSDGRLSEAVVRPQFSGPVEVVGEMLDVKCGNVRIPTVKTDVGFRFDAEAGGSYTLVPADRAGTGT